MDLKRKYDSLQRSSSFGEEFKSTDKKFKFSTENPFKKLPEAIVIKIFDFLP